jgi:type IV pilus assembly protein PilA
MTRHSAQAGFTFIELLSVVVIIGLLTTIAMPNIKNYSARAKVSEAMIALTACRTVVSEVYLSAGGTLPAGGTWGCESGNTSKYVDSIDTTDFGVIKVTLSPAVGDARIAVHVISMAPLNRANQPMDDNDVGTSVYRWRCGSNVDGTDVDVTFLPSTCRGN